MRFLLIVFGSAFLFFSCGNTEGKKEAIDTEAVSENEAQNEDSEAKVEEPETASDCDEFITQYEEWATSYIDLVEKFMKNPTDPELSKEYQESAQKAMTWAEQWTQKFMHCATDEANAKRFEDISKKMEERMKKIGM